MQAGIAPRPTPDRPGASLEERLEQGELLQFETCPFPLPAAADRDLLRRQHLGEGKEIAYDLAHDRLIGMAPSGEQERLKTILASGIAQAQVWLRGYLPHYAAGLKVLRACFHPEEEATRCLRMSARNDLLHVDAARPAAGSRLLRLGINLNPTDPRVWVTSDPLAKVLPVYGPRSGLIAPPPAWQHRVRQRVLGLVRPHRLTRSPYDDFMLGFSDYLKLCDEFQDKAPRRTWHFGPHAAWLAFTDGLVHAELRGRWVLDYLFLVPPSCWTRPEFAPTTLLSRLGLSFHAGRAA